MAIKSMKVEDAHEIAYWLAVEEDEQGSSRLTEKEKFAIKVLLQSYIDVSEKLSAYENADLIERHKPIEKINETLLNLQGKLTPEAVVEFSGLVCEIADIPKFDPERQVDNEQDS